MVWLVAAMSFGLIGAARAADLPLKAPRLAAAYEWTGPYLGVAGGIAWGHSDQTDTGVNVGDGSYAVNGGVAGGTLGYNSQQGGFVFGLEGDLPGPISAAAPMSAAHRSLFHTRAAASSKRSARCARASAPSWARPATGWRMRPAASPAESSTPGSVLAGVGQRFPHQLDRGRRDRGRAYAQLDGQARISLRRPRQTRHVRHRAGHAGDGELHRQHRSRRDQLPVCAGSLPQAHTTLDDNPRKIVLTTARSLARNRSRSTVEFSRAARRYGSAAAAALSVPRNCGPGFPAPRRS